MTHEKLWMLEFLLVVNVTNLIIGLPFNFVRELIYIKAIY